MSSPAAHQPSVSVVIPAFNEVDNIAACLRCWRPRDYPGVVEVTVVDNACEDDTSILASILASVCSRPATTWSPSTGCSTSLQHPTTIR